MEPEADSGYYDSLTPLEQTYYQRLLEVFSLVNPQKPEKGIRALILRAHRDAQVQDIPLESALQQMLEGATERTHRRLELLKQCRLRETD